MTNPCFESAAPTEIMQELFRALEGWMAQNLKTNKDMNIAGFGLTSPLGLVDLWPFEATISAHCQPLL